MEVGMLETHKLGFPDGDFGSAVAEEISTPGVAPLAAASRYFTRRLTESLSDLMGPRLIRSLAIDPGNWPGRYETLRALASTGTETWYPELRFATRLDEALQDISIETHGFAVRNFHLLGIQADVKTDFIVRRLGEPIDMVGQTAVRSAPCGRARSGRGCWPLRNRNSPGPSRDTPTIDRAVFPYRTLRK
jgi:NAD(P)-dependent dehydrogenase (short-subunit alcohol dehydrogenase family)